MCAEAVMIFRQRVLIVDVRYRNKNHSNFIPLLVGELSSKLSDRHIRYIQPLPNSYNLLVCVSDEALKIIEQMPYVEKHIPIPADIYTYQISLESSVNRQEFIKKLSWSIREWFMFTDCRKLWVDRKIVKVQGSPRLADFIRSQDGVVSVEKFYPPRLRD